MIWLLVLAIVGGWAINATALHDPELGGALLLASIIAAVYMGAAYENRKNRR